MINNEKERENHFRSLFKVALLSLWAKATYRIYLLVHPGGIEPPLKASETFVLSITLWVYVLNYTIFI